MPWIKEFRDRVGRFEGMLPPREGEVPVSVKIRIDTGCYSRGCCPHAFNIIDRKIEELREQGERFVLEEHETGPEIILYLAVATAGLSLAKSVVDLVRTVIKARSDRQKHGDRHHDPVTLVVRRLEKGDTLAEERVMTFAPNDRVTKETVDEALLDGCRKIMSRVQPEPAKRMRTKRYSGRRSRR
jgi:hypothetical protein